MLIVGVETLVAILRNKLASSNVDVELFFKAHANLVAKMKRMEMRDMNAEVVNAHLEVLPEIVKGWESSAEANEDKENLSDLLPLLRWAVAFCTGAQIEL